MKIKKELVEERERFVVQLFRADQKLSVPEANRMTKERFGSMMRAQRMYELRKIGRSLNAAPPEPQGAILEAARVPNRQLPDGMAVVSLKDPQQGEFLTRALQDLRDAGIVKVGVAHVTNQYAVVVQMKP